ncbi:TIR domain-containing protein [Taibaiella koreensis]|uniref:TIR domain-containing protein n=1 Tax=Taibaiella koreensis TaxID=1268548 RepID=UPI000E59AEA8|nr:nucleotide-binding protein [Taibaiella koreensis]
MGKFFGNLEALQNLVNTNGLVGNWSEITNAHKFSTNDGGVLLWYPSTKTLQCQGRGPSKSTIQKLINSIDENGIVTESATVAHVTTSEVFVVYGHDETSRDQLELILGKLGIAPFILAKIGGQGLTLIEALDKQVGQNGAASAGIVLLTPDDMGYSLRQGESALKHRARQNVILEMGMLLSKLGRTHTIILVKGDLERPSDTDGIIYLSYQKHIKECLVALAKRLEAIGYKIDHKKALEAAS